MIKLIKYQKNSSKTELKFLFKYQLREDHEQTNDRGTVVLFI